MVLRALIEILHTFTVTLTGLTVYMLQEQARQNAQYLYIKRTATVTTSCFIKKKSKIPLQKRRRTIRTSTRKGEGGERRREGGRNGGGGGGKRHRSDLKNLNSTTPHPHPPPPPHPRNSIHARGTGVLYRRCTCTGVNRGSHS